MRNILSAACLIFLFSCNNRNTAQSSIDSSKGLKDYYKDYFTIGVSVSPNSLRSDEADLIVQQFSSITPENAMKMRPIHPKENEYYWKDADSIVAFAKRNHLKIRGHALVWHQETPEWLFIDSTGRPAGKELVLQRIKDHITTVISRYKGSIYAWDVVNEAISDNKNDFYRKSKLYETCGEEFIAKAFEYAHAADPQAILFYNDYNEIDPVKRAKIISLIKRLRNAGIPVSAVGLQAHWSVVEPAREQLEATLKDFSSLELPLQITEMDISLYRKQPGPAGPKRTDTDTTFTIEKEAKQTNQYEMCFAMFRKYKKYITGVTFWDISDRHSWLDDFPIKNRKDHPLLFDRSLKPKKAFWKVALF
jgi:endo-1,4-beta-xylanase